MKNVSERNYFNILYEIYNPFFSFKIKFSKDYNICIVHFYLRPRFSVVFLS